MKLSQWNSYIRLNEKIGIIYNSLTDTYICIRDEGILNMLPDMDVSILPEKLRVQMTSAGALVPATKDEPKELERLIRELDEDDRALNIIVNPTLDCNFHCWYCYETHMPDSIMSQDMVVAVKRYVHKKIGEMTNLKTIHLSFFGGEPLLGLEDVVMPMLKSVKKLCEEYSIRLTVHFTTNGSLINDSLIDRLIPYSPSFQITLDGGRNNHNSTRFDTKSGNGSFDTILANIRRLAEAGLRTVLRINYTKANIGSTTEIIDFMEGIPVSSRRYVSIDYQRVWQDSAAKVSEEEIENFISICRKRWNDLGFAVSNHKFFDYVRESCYADKKNEILINYNGDVFFCTARDFKSSHRKGILTPEGKVILKSGIMEQKMSAKFSKPICRNCRIAPICGGGCRTKCIEQSHHDQCNLGLTEEMIDDLILSRFEERFL